MNFAARRPTSKTRALITVVVLVLSLTLVATAPAKTVGGITFPDTVTLAGKTLKMVGMGDRIKFFVQVYVAGLYMEKPLKTDKAVVAAEQVKYVLIQVDSKLLTRERFIDTTNKGFYNNNPKTLMVTLAPKVKQFFALFGTTKPKRGDKIGLLYVPGKGTTVSYRGKDLGTIPGADFMRALFRCWLGENPGSEDLKKALLGQEE